MWFKSFLFALCVMLVGCGFRPVYKTDTDNKAVLTQTAQIQILPIADESGRQFGQALKNLLNPNNLSQEKMYTLSVKITEQLNEDQGILGDKTATRTTMTQIAQFELTDKKTKKVLLNDSLRELSSYNITMYPYATLTAEQTTRKRLLDALAQDVALRLAHYFYQQDS